MSRRLALVLVLAACSGSVKPEPVGTEPTPAGPTPPAPPIAVDPPVKPTAVRGTVSIAATLDATPEQRRGVVFMYWLTRTRSEAMMSGAFELQDFVDLLTRMTVVGPVDLTAAGASAPFELPAEPGPIVVTAILDSRKELFATLVGEGGAGNLLGLAQVDVPEHGGAAASVELSLVNAVEPPHETCTGPRRHLVLLDAPEVAGSIGNPTARRLCVIVPASYAKKKKRRYPVIYDFPGWGGTDAAMSEDQSLLEKATTAAREAILVLVDTSTKVGSSYLVDSPVNGAWDSFLTRRAIPAVDKKFRTLATRDGRATAGHSTGGFGAVSFGLRHPELFGVVTGSAPDGLDTGYYFFGDDGGTVYGWFQPLLRAEDASGGPGFFASWAADWSPDATNPRGYAWPIDPATGQENKVAADQWRAAGPASWLRDPARAAELARAFSGRIFLAVGEHDEAGLTAPTQRFSAQLTAAHIDNTLLVLPGGHMNITGLAGATLRFALEHTAVMK